MANQNEDTFTNMDFGLDIEKVLNARLIELNSLSKEIKQKGNKLSLQRIPRFMRRRAASHNPKRVPNKFVKHPLPIIGNSVLKERRRKQRKKHVNKLKKRLSIKKRNAKEGRTLLHIWFRKRFKLIKELNYLIPLQNNTKNYRNLHKIATKQCAFYYRPLSRLIEIKLENRQELSEFLILIKCFFNESNLDECLHQELDLFFFKDNHCLVPVSILLHSELTIWLSISIDYYSQISQLLNELFKNANLKFTIYELQFERFRLIGPKAIKCLEHQLNCSASSQNDKASLAGLLESSECSKILTNNLTILLKDEEKSILDVLVPRKEAKKWWYSLVKNKGHLVGGKINYELYALQNDLICYPSIGCLDCPIQKDANQLKLLKSILKLKFKLKEKETDEMRLQIVRSNDFLKQCEAPFENADAIASLYDETIDKQSLINIKLQAIKKGAIKENDLIYLPTSEDLAQLNKAMGMNKEDKFLDQSFEDAPIEKVKLKKLKISDFSKNSNELESVLNSSSRTVIGLIELGKFSLKSGKSEAFGVLATDYLIELIKLNRQCNCNSLNVLIRSEANFKFRFCSIKISNFRLF